MGKKFGVTMSKRQKESTRLKRQQEKMERRKAAKAAGPTQRENVPGEDPDIAGIVPGPQPIVPAWLARRRAAETEEP